MGQIPGKLRFYWTGVYWKIGVENETFQLGTLAGEISERVPPQAVLRTYAAKSVLRRKREYGHCLVHRQIDGAHL